MKTRKKPSAAKTKRTKSRGKRTAATRSPAVTERSGRWLSEREFDRLRNSLREAQETLNAIREGEVDAVVVQGPRGNHIYSLTGAEQPYRVFVERMQEGAATISSDGVVLYANQRFADMVGQPLERVIGSELALYLDTAGCNEVRSVFKNQEEVVKCETLMPRPGTAPLPVNLTASQLPFQGQNVVCLIITDLSAQKQSEELRLAKDLAEKANVTKDTFLAALSHELRTPLNPVLVLASEAAENPDLPARVRADFATICTSIELEARLIDDLLDLTRISHGKLALTVSLVDTHTILNNAVATIQSELNQKGISLKLDWDRKPCLVKGDSVRLQQVFWNVLKNAVKFTPPNGEITVTTRAAPSKRQLTITISDTGIGMTDQELKVVFEAFTQGDHAKKPGGHQFGGLGLGLSITRMIVNMHAGEIQAVSQGRGRGATFIIELPLDPAAVIGSPARPPAPAAGNQAGADRKGFRILLVEDHEPTRTALTRLLTRRHHTVSTAANATEARALAAANDFQLIISDIGLPDENGLALMKELNGRYKVKGIALTGYGMEQDVISSQQSGFVSHLTKPIRIESLEAAMLAAMAAPFEPVS